jgi:hypothetical protein
VYPITLTSGGLGIREGIDMDVFVDRVNYLIADEVQDRKRHDLQVRGRIIEAREHIRKKRSIIEGMAELGPR